MVPELPSWMIYVLYGNSVLDLAIFLVPQQLAVPDLVEEKFKSPAGDCLEMKETF